MHMQYFRMQSGAFQIIHLMSTTSPARLRARDTSTTKLSFVPPAVAGAVQCNDVTEYHETVAQLIEWLKNADGVELSPPKLMPHSVMLPPSVDAAFVGQWRVIFGASKLKPLIIVPITALIVT